MGMTIGGCNVQRSISPDVASIGVPSRRENMKNIYKKCFFLECEVQKIEILIKINNKNVNPASAF